MDRLAELPYRLRPRPAVAATTWPVSPAERARVSIAWPDRYEWAMSGLIVATLRDALARTGTLKPMPVPQEHEGVIRLDVTVDGATHPVMLDYFDLAPVNAAALSACALYIKLQFDADGYDDPRIIPGGYPVTGVDYYKYFGAFRRQGNAAPDIEVLARFGYTFNGEQRRKAVELLTKAGDIRCTGAGGKVRYSRFLKEVARAKLSLDLPGKGNYTHRVAEFLGLGTLLLAPRYRVAMPVPLEPGVHYAAIADDLSDLVEVSRHYLKDEPARRALAQAGADYFDRYLHCDQLAGYYLRTLLDCFGA